MFWSVATSYIHLAHKYRMSVLKCGRIATSHETVGGKKKKETVEKATVGTD